MNKCKTTYVLFMLLSLITFLSCSNSPSTITITPKDPTIAVATTQQFTATAHYSYIFGNTKTEDITSSVTWSSGTKTVATIDTKGLATGIANGTTTITATYESISASTNLVVGGTAIADVYVVGYSSDSTPTVWKNGVKTDLTTINEAAYSVYVSGTDVYVAGTRLNTTDIPAHFVPTVLKNGNITDLPVMGCDARAYSVFVSGTDVYVAGYYGDCATYIAAVWKNGVRTDLNLTGTDAMARSVFVNGTNVYVSGYYSPNDGSYNAVAAVWKNGVRTNLSVEDPLLGSAQANSVYVSGTDVYVAGYYNNGSNDIAAVWKIANGGAPTKTDLPDESLGAQANSVYVNGSDVYISGYYNNATSSMAAVWKITNGGVPIKTDLPDGLLGAQANSVYVNGSDLYVAGYYYDGSNNIAAIWKNGVKTDLTVTGSYAAANSVYVNLHY
ncbi:MAG: Ig-like domain-containing protein [bacterium]